MDPVEEQLAAFNDRNLDRFVAAYAPDAVIESGGGDVITRGHDGMRGLYGPLFARSHQLRAEVVSQMRVGAYVVAEERITGIELEGASPEIQTVAIFRLAGDKIEHLRLLM